MKGKWMISTSNSRAKCQQSKGVGEAAILATGWKEEQGCQN